MVMGAGNDMNGASGILKRKKSDAIIPEEKTAAEGSEILRLKKEAIAALSLSSEADVPGGMERWLKVREEEAEAEAAQPNKKRRKVVKERLTAKYIMLLRTNPHITIDDMTADELASRSDNFRQLYAIRKYIDGKWLDYENALISQHDLLGYAEDESEVVVDDEQQRN